MHDEERKPRRQADAVPDDAGAGAAFRRFCRGSTLHPLGVMVVIEAKHMCMQMRGVEKQNAITTTSDFCGAFNQAKTREEFMNLLRGESKKI